MTTSPWGEGALTLAGDLVCSPAGWRLRDAHGVFWALPDVPDSLVHRLRQADGTVTEASLMHALSAEEAEIWREITGALRANGLLTEAPCHGPETVVVIVGSGTVAQVCAEAVLDLPPVAVHLIDPSAPDRVLRPASRAATGADALRIALVRQGHDHDRVAVGGHWSDLSSRSRAHLVVVADPHIEVDRAITSHLERQGLAHVSVSVHRDQATVGPFVIPGATACTGCRDRHLSADDPAWPSLAAQLTSRRALVDPVLARWAAAVVRGWTQRLVNDAEPHAASLAMCGGAAAQVVLWRGRDGVPQTQQWPPHPQCPCQAVRG